MVSPPSRRSFLGMPSGCGQQKLGISHFKTPSQAQYSNSQDPEIPLDETHSLVFRQTSQTPYVQVVYRHPNTKTHTSHRHQLTTHLAIIVSAFISWRARLTLAVGNLLADGGRKHSLARLQQARHRILHSFRRSLAAHNLPERTSGVVERPFYILTSLLVAAREALSLSRRIG